MKLLIAGALAFFATAGMVRAQDDSAGTDYAKDTVTGDWEGRRTRWAHSGASLDLDLKSDWLHCRGGATDGGQPMNQLDIKLNADLERLWGWTSTRALIDFLYDWGDGVNTHHAHSIIGVSNIEWPINTTRVFQAWIEKRLFADSLGLLVGLYPFDSEFSAVESGGIFLHPSFGASPDVSLTRGPSIFNNSAFGFRLKWQPGGLPFYAQAALLDGIPGDPSQPKATHIKFAKGDGSFHIVELGLAPSHGEGRGNEVAKAAIGAWGYTTRVADLTDFDIDGRRTLRRSSGWYLLGEKTAWRVDEASKRSLVAFARYSGTDGNSTAIDRALNLGLRLQGPIYSRPDDVAGVAATRANIGEKFRRLQAAAGIETTHDESVLELTYRAQITKWLAVQPVVQRIRHPGAVVGAATIFGSRFEVAL